jgi:hypothetical protein
MLKILFYFSFLLILCNSCKNQQKEKKIEKFNCELTTPFNFDNIKMYQDSCMETETWTLEFEYDLNGDNINEKFLGIESYSRGMNYVIFTKKNDNWNLLTANETIPSGHLEIQVLETKNEEWFDFVAMQPSGRDGIIESYYSWNGKEYFLKEQKETSF